MANDEQTIVQKHRKNLDDRKTLSFEKTTLKDLKDQIVQTEQSIVSEISKNRNSDDVNEKSSVKEIEHILNSFTDKEIEDQSKLMDILNGFFDDVVESGFSKDLSRFLPQMESFSAWYKDAEQESHKRLDAINATFENAIKNASESQINLLKLQHKATITQEKKRFDLEVKSEQQRKLEQSLANAEGNVTLDLLKRFLPGIGLMSKSLSGIQESSKVWNRFKGEGFWKRLGGYLAYNEKGLFGSLGDLLMMKGGRGIKGLFSKFLKGGLINPFKNIIKGLSTGGLKGMLGGMKGNFKAGGKLLKAGGLLTAGLGVFNAFDIEKQVKNGEMTREEANRAQSGNAGGTVGAIAGGALGMLLGPIGAIVGAWLGEKIGSFIGEYIFDNWDTIVKWCSDTWDTFLSGLKWVGDKITDWWKGSIKYIKKKWNGMIQWFKDLGTGIKNSIVGIWYGVGDWFKDLGKNIWNGFWSTFDSIKKSVGDSVDGAVKNVTGIWDSITKFCSDLWTSVTKSIKGAWDDVVNFCKDPAKNMGIDTKVITEIFDKVTGAIGKWWDDQVAGVKKGWKDLKSFFGFGGDDEDENEDAKKQVETTLKRRQPEIVIKKSVGKDITDAVNSSKNNNNASSNIIQQNNVNNVNANQTTLHQTPILSTNQPDPNLYFLGSGWNAGVGVIPM